MRQGGGSEMRQRRHHATSLRLVVDNTVSVEMPSRARASIPVIEARRSAARGDKLRSPESTKDKCDRDIPAWLANQTARRLFLVSQSESRSPTAGAAGSVASMSAKFAQRKRRVKPKVRRDGNDTSLPAAYDPGMITRVRKRTPPRLFLREWRRHLDLTQEQLADRLDTYKGQISNYENGKRDVSSETAAALANALGIDVPDLYRDPEQPSADALLRDEPPDFRDEVIGIIKALKRLRGGRAA